jgi:hypothetical protein
LSRPVVGQVGIEQNRSAIGFAPLPNEEKANVPRPSDVGLRFAISALAMAPTTLDYTATGL